MEKGKERHMYPGNNTSLGFYSYYSHILPQREANHIFCIKGGPGVGKSTFMKDIGRRLQENGLDVEYLHCSSDPGSLDGVACPKARAAVIDGTAPHVVDPVHPGAVDEIVNLGEYWDLAGIRQHREDILRYNEETGRLFASAYRYLAAARQLLDDIAAAHARTADFHGADVLALSLIARELPQAPADRQGRTKKQFASAITPDGVMDTLNTLADETWRVYALASVWGVGVHRVLGRIVDAAALRGLDAELYYCPMYPDSKIEHVLIPALKLAFFSENAYYGVPYANRETIDLKPLSGALSDNERAAIAYDAEAFESLLDEAVASLKRAKRTHDQMEKCYIPHMDFKSIDEKAGQIADRILRYAKG